MSTESDAMTIMQFKKIPETILETSTTEINNNEEICTEIEQPSNLLCILFKSEKIGCAYYVFDEKTVNYYEEMIDIGPQYFASINIYRETRPKYVLTFGNVADEFVEVLIDLFVSGTNTTVSSDTVRNVPENFFLLPTKEYTYDICKAVIAQLNAESVDDELCEIKREVYLHSCINFDYRLSIQAIGTVIKFLNKNCTFFDISKEELEYLHINQVSMKDHVLLDNSTFLALNIFAQRSHDASFKRGTSSSFREGLSIYRLFSAHCKSKIGLTTLRNFLVSPISCKETLETRLEFIDFVLQPQNSIYVESIQEHMKQLGTDLNAILKRIENFRGTSKDWRALYKAIYYTTAIDDISAPYRHKVKLLRELNIKITSDLIGLGNSIDNALDFTQEQSRVRPIIKFGLDEMLDTKKFRQQDMSKDLTAAARFAANDLPDFLNECAIIYLPEMGHLIAIKEWEPNCDPEELKKFDYHLMFTLKGTIHYKNPLCVELDRRVGDINAEIIDHENRILRRLSGFILKHKKEILASTKAVGVLDCLISMAVQASQNTYVRPVFSSTNVTEIKEGRHPLLEHLITNYQPNDLYSGNDHSHIKIITGPNGSGKSMYLRQIALVVYLAHIGSYVPAKSAKVALLQRIHSRIRATESAAVRLSAFMIDVTQIGQALHNPLPRSLILLDEFGKGTSDENGIAMLAGVLKMFIEKGADCPHVLLSTHFQEIANYIPESALVTYHKMDYTKDDNGLCFLYKIVEGISMSFGLDIAEIILDDEFTDRAREILHSLSRNTPIRPLEANLRGANIKDLHSLSVPQPDELDQ